MDIEISVIVKEFIFHVEEIKHPIYGHITEMELDGRTKYSWAISHDYKPEENSATVYRPSKRITETQEKAEELLLAYVNGFTTFGVESSPSYK